MKELLPFVANKFTTELARDVDQRRQLKRAGAPVSGLRKVIQQISDHDKLLTLEAKVAKLEARMNGHEPAKFLAIALPFEMKARNPALLPRIREVVCEAWGIHRKLLIKRNSETVSRAKFAGCWLAVELTDFNGREIAPVFGLNDHTGVFHNARRMREIMSLEPKMAANLNVLRDQLKKEFQLS